MAKVDTKPSRTERTERAAAIHTELDEAAAAINALHADILARVIEAKAWNIHRDCDGFSALREWLVTTFDFHLRTAADLAAIARTAGKFTVLAETATSARARIDRVAAAVRRLDATKALRVYARTPYKEPVSSPFDADTRCPTPEHLIAQYCIHATVKDVHAQLDELQAALDNGEELLDGLGQQSLQRLDLVETENGMFVLSGLLSSDTGKLFAKLLTTAVPPPRQDEVDEDGSLPPAANRRAEAFHQVLAAHGADPNAAKRHGHTATLHLSVDIETLAGDDTGRVPTLEGDPISLGKARLLACEGLVIPNVFNYATGEAIELGRALRLPNSALRRKLELEQPGGCAWTGCLAPVQWTEAHHIRHWANGGPTVAENLILLCRFHHGRIHTPGWTIQKTGPGKALIVHHEGHEDTDPDLTCGCADWRTDTDLDLGFADDIANAFPTGLYPEEWSETLKPDLEAAAEQAETEQVMAAAKAARAKVRARFTTPTPEPEPETGTATESETGTELEPSTPLAESRRPREPVGAASAAPAPDYVPPSFLPCPLRDAVAGKAPHRSPARNRQRLRALPHARTPNRHTSHPNTRRPAGHHHARHGGPTGHLRADKPIPAHHGARHRHRHQPTTVPAIDTGTSPPATAFVAALAQNDHHTRPFPPTPPRPLPGSSGNPRPPRCPPQTPAPAHPPPRHRCRPWPRTTITLARSRQRTPGPRRLPKCGAAPSLPPYQAIHSVVS
ncbi:HNH endonuclease signature motif containing protein [Glycomyces tarimensis]